MNKQEILLELEEKYKKMKTALGIKYSLEELDNEFIVKDFILKEGFVATDLARQISHRIVEAYMNWNEYFHSLIMPNPQNMLNMSESKIFSQEEKKEISRLMKNVMEISSRNGLITLGRDEKIRGEFINHSVNFWKKDFKPKITEMIKKINKEWAELK